MICHKHLGLDKIKTKLPISPLRSAPPANSQLIKLFGVIPNCNLCLTPYPSTDPFSSIFRVTSEYNFLPALASVQATRNRCPNGSLSPQESKSLQWTTRPSMICPCPMLLWPNPLWATDIFAVLPARNALPADTYTDPRLKCHLVTEASLTTPNKVAALPPAPVLTIC